MGSVQGNSRILPRLWLVPCSQNFWGEGCSITGDVGQAPARWLRASTRGTLSERAAVTAAEVSCWAGVVRSIKAHGRRLHG